MDSVGIYATGEYCLTYNNKQGNTNNGMRNSGSKKVFDFTIK